jgi:hypothetical protein
MALLTLAINQTEGCAGVQGIPEVHAKEFLNE